MYLLELTQDKQQTILGVFESIKQGRDFVSQIDGYVKEKENGYVVEYIDYKKLPDYLEIKFNGNIVPFSKWMFTTHERIEIDWKEVPNLSLKGKGMVKGATKVDAYSVNNEDVKEYIKKREHSYDLVKAYLEKRGFEVTRNFRGSEDGEAILYRKQSKDKWIFLTHLDPVFFKNKDKDILLIVKEFID